MPILAKSTNVDEATIRAVTLFDVRSGIIIKHDLWLLCQFRVVFFEICIIKFDPQQQLLSSTQ